MKNNRPNSNNQLIQNNMHQTKENLLTTKLLDIYRSNFLEHYILDTSRVQAVPILRGMRELSDNDNIF
jgi:hypothetical protein